VTSTAAREEDPRPGLRRALGLKEAVALGLGGTIGGGIFVLIGEAAGRAGPAALASFALAFLASLAIALPYAELACRFPLAGGGYASVRKILGERWGFYMGWVYWGSYLLVSGYVTLGFGGYLSALTGLPHKACAIGLVAACIALNLAGVRLSGRAQILVLGAGVTGLLSFGLLSLPRLEADLLTPFAPQGVLGVAAAVPLAFLAMNGFDVVAAAGEEVSDPGRNLPRAILITLLLVTGLYLLATLAAVGVLSVRELSNSGAPLSDAASAALGPAGVVLVATAAILTTAATANAVLVVTSRILFAMARDGLSHPSLFRVSAATGAPYAAVVASGGVMALVALTLSVPLSAAIGGFLYVMHYLPPLISLVHLRWQKPQSTTGTSTTSVPAFVTPVPSLVLPLAFCGCFVLLVGTGPSGILGGGIWIALGIAYRMIGVRTPRRQEKERREKPETSEEKVGGSS
jgi:APA family basic amino acid/polyamine antiporter